MKKWNMIVDVDLCENCNNCFLTTKDEHVDNDFPGYAAPQPLHGHEWISIERKVRGEGHMVDAAYLVTTCNQCDNAPCIKAGGGALSKRDDGIVIIDPVKAKGRKDIVDSCPYGAIWWNEELQLPQKWIFDAHLLDSGWKEPRCVQSCPTGALKSLKVTDNEMVQISKKEKLEVLGEGFRTKPRVHYKNLYRFNKCFIGGSVVAEANGEMLCVEDAKVILYKNQKEATNLITDVYGDFKFDNIGISDDKYTIGITHSEYGNLDVNVMEFKESLYLGELKLVKS